MAPAAADERRLLAPPAGGEWSTVAVVARPPAALRAGLAAWLRGGIAAESGRGNGAVALVLCFAAGTAAYAGLPAEPATQDLAIAAAALVLLLYAEGRRPLARAALAAGLAVIAGMAAARLETWRLATPMLGSAVTTEVTGRLLSATLLPDGRTRLLIDVAATARPMLAYPPARIRVTAAALAGLRPGQGLSARMRLLPAAGPVRPGGYDFSRSAYFSGIGASGFVLGAPRPADLPPPSPATRLATAIGDWRQRIAERVALRIGGAEGAVAAALTVGADAAIPPALAEAMRQSGLYHVVSISGLHMALVAGMVMAIARRALALLPTVAERFAVRKAAAVLALAAAAAYLALSGAAVATQRAFVMLAVMLVALLFDRAALAMRNLALAALAILAITPHAIAGASFQLSFAATAALIAGWSVAPALPRRSMLARLAAAPLAIAWTSLLAGGATTLLTAWQFSRVAPLGLVGNLLAMPVVTAIIMPAALVAVAAMPFGLDGPALDVMGHGIAAMNAIAMAVAAMAPAGAVGIVPGAAVAAFAMALAGVMALSGRLRLLFLPVGAVAVALAWSGRSPTGFIGEEGRLVAVAAGKTLLVDRPSPRGFVVDAWARALAVSAIRMPAGDGPACDRTLCILDSGSGLVVRASDAAMAAIHCRSAALLVITDATAQSPCRPGEATVVTRRDLARAGSVEFFLAPGRPAEIRHALGAAPRPWHAQRAFARAARGLAERRPAAGGQ